VGREGVRRGGGRLFLLQDVHAKETRVKTSKRLVALSGAKETQEIQTLEAAIIH